MKHSIPYIPEKNGVAERKNRSLKGMETCMMEAKNFPPKFWDEVIKYWHPTSIIGLLISSLMV